MALTLIAETGAGITGANTYATRTQGDAYHDARLHADAWTGATDATKEIALAWATRYLDANVVWLGDRQTLEQPLEWPRQNIEWRGFEAPDDWMPDQVVRATCELARLLIAADLQAEQASDGIKSLGLGQNALAIEFKDGAKTRRVPLAIGELLEGVGHVVYPGAINQRKTTR